MWNTISNSEELDQFMHRVYSFHDSCIKEMHYSSGAYVTEDLSMYPINDKRNLRVIIQRQFSDMPVIEMEFLGLKYMKLYPYNEDYTCEILDATMIMKDSCIYWCDWGGLSEADLDTYDGTLICASGLRWRVVEGCLGKETVYGTDD